MMPFFTRYITKSECITHFANIINNTQINILDGNFYISNCQPQNEYIWMVKIYSYGVHFDLYLSEKSLRNIMPSIYYGYQDMPNALKATVIYDALNYTLSDLSYDIKILEIKVNYEINVDNYHENKEKILFSIKASRLNINIFALIRFYNIKDLRIILNHMINSSERIFTNPIPHEMTYVKMYLASGFTNDIKDSHISDGNLLKIENDISLLISVKNKSQIIELQANESQEDEMILKNQFYQNQLNTVYFIRYIVNVSIDDIKNHRININDIDKIDHRRIMINYKILQSFEDIEIYNTNFVQIIS